jgi:hypothetical protein
VKQHLAAVEKITFDDAGDDFESFGATRADESKIPVTWPAKIESELFLTMVAMRRF